jgi:hypothetical protein
MLQPSGTTPALVEPHRSVLLAGKELQLEALGRREGINVVAEGVVIGKGDGRPDRNDEHERMELGVLLSDLVDAGRRSQRRGPPARIEADHGVGDRRAVGLADGDDELGGGGRHAGDEQKQGEERAHERILRPQW